MRKWQRYTQEFKDQAVERLRGCTNVEALARELNVSRGILYRGRTNATADHQRPSVRTRCGLAGDCGFKEKKWSSLKLALADRAIEADFFKGALQRVEDRHRNSGSTGVTASTTTSEK